MDFRHLRARFAALLVGALAAAFAPTLAFAQQAGLNIIRDTEIEAIIRKDAEPVWRAAGLNPADVKLHLIGDKELNAFVTNGQQMFLNTGLIKETENPNQLIGVIAHETGHMAGGHSVRSGDMNKAAMAPFLLTLGLGILAAAAGAPDAAAALLSSSQYFGTLGALGYSRVQESAADQAAITYLQKANISSRGLVDFFDNFRYEEVFSEAHRFPFFQSHPISSERIELLRRRVEEQKNYDTKDSADSLRDHEIMKAKLFGFIEPPAQTFIKYKEDDKSFPARYARAIAYYRATETERALKAIDALLTEQPENPYLWELKGHVLFESGRPKEAEAPHRKSVELAPKAALLRVNLAQAILAQDDPKRSDEIVAELQKSLALENDNALAWRMMAQAYDAKGQPGQARLAAAEENFFMGDLTRARIFALRAREMLTKDTPEWRRATDIVLVANPSQDELKSMAQGRG
ncbi:MAG: M48 family metalloprotease [Caulobacteraceae bacterium]